MHIVSAENQNSWSFSMGQFDVNDSNDSSEIRLERLSDKNMFGDMELKPFVGFMMNEDDGKYFYSGLRKNYSISPKWIFTHLFPIPAIPTYLVGSDLNEDTPYIKIWPQYFAGNCTSSNPTRSFSSAGSTTAAIVTVAVFFVISIVGVARSVEIFYIVIVLGTRICITN